jgi:hypothetical protein
LTNSLPGPLKGISKLAIVFGSLKGGGVILDKLSVIINRVKNNTDASIGVVTKFK